jgi:voltage-gated potassium channel
MQSSILRVGSWQRLAWETVLAVFAIYTAIEIPLDEVYNLTENRTLFFLNVLVSVAFVVAIFVNMKTPIVVGSHEITAPKDLRRRYLRGRFWVDLFAALPFELILWAMPGASAGIRGIRLLSLVRALRLPAFFKRREIRQHADRGVARLLIFLFWFLLAANLVTCGWLFLGAGNIDATLSDPAKYARAFYWCITTLATVGYGDITPVTIPQTLYATAVMILGVAIYGYVISSVTALLSNIDVARNQYMKTMDKVNAFCAYNDLPEGLQKRIRNYHEYLFESRLGYSEGDVLAELPDSIKSDVAMHLHRELLAKVPLFRSASENVMREIVLELEALVVPPNDYVFRAGDEGEEMYFIRRGIVDVLSADGSKTFATLGDGAFFGEVALLFRQPRNASIRAREYVDLYVLKSSAVEKVMKRYPEFATHLKSEAEARKGS